MKISLIAATSKNGIIGNGPDIPWRAKGEQFIFKAMTFNQWLLLGRKTFESMGRLPNRKYAVITRNTNIKSDENLLVFSSLDEALTKMAALTDHLFVAGGGEIYHQMIDRADTLHLSQIDLTVEGDVSFPKIPNDFKQVFSQPFESNINYTYQIWQKTE
jgi:dihydrofolate reductase (trimethoprim resistance protein)